ncbi:CPBP family intramembrane metalloprotease [Duganella sp. CY15W]|uniref:CPBP family intramembrane glutamic endopeptidase n=1 Tax=Duganella sp. CY15W TaxID=2692172 RepID=UPI00136CDD08|nr:CPBP family intramembrane glutamic endopeptidase [Duganella sp. CY15W]MYM27289.1 CPBP family intramembrane metalloprotease [Duganella sp. CY15W]
MTSEAPKITLRRQLATCALLSAIAVAVIAVFHQPPYLTTLLAGVPLSYQVLIGAAFLALYWSGTKIGYRYMTKSEAARSTAENYARLDLSGWNPLWISLAAGFGEELLFRGALQPLMGIYAAAALFTLAHIRAYRFQQLNRKTLMQAGMLFFTGVAFGAIAQHIGLVAAMMIHASADIVGLYTIRQYVLTQARP